MRIFSGIRASGDKTLGNYSGGYRQYAQTQEQGEAVFCIVDLHSITTAYEPEGLQAMGVRAGLHATNQWSDADARFALTWFVR